MNYSKAIQLYRERQFTQAAAHAKKALHDEIHNFNENEIHEMLWIISECKINELSKIWK